MWDWIKETCATGVARAKQALTGRVPLTVLYVSATCLEFAFAYFMGQSLADNTQEILEDQGSGQYSRMVLAGAVVLACADAICNITYFNPIEGAYQASLVSSPENDGRPLSRSERLGDAITLVMAYTSFAAGASANTAVLASINPYARWPLNMIFTGLGVAYYQMLSHEDLIKHSRFIFSRLFSLKHSLLLQALKSPLKSFEMLVQLASNGLYRGVLFAYVAREFMRNNFKTADDGIVLTVMGVAAFATFYGTFFTRTLPLRERLFTRDDDIAVSVKAVLLENKGSFAKEIMLRLLRAGGVLYFICRYLDEPEVFPVASVTGIFLLLQAGLTSYQIIKNGYLKSHALSLNNEDELSQAEPAVHGRLVATVATAVNLSSRAARLVAFFGFLYQLNQVTGLALKLGDLLALTVSLGIPIGVNDFLYFNPKLQETWERYAKQYRLERSTHQFGCGCFFRSVQEYGDPEEGQLISMQPGSSRS